jgi:HK97 family phage major capsid protein
MLKQLKEKQRSLITRADEILAEAKTQNRELTDAEAQELAEIRDNVKFIKDRIELIGDVEGLDRECGDGKATTAPVAAEEKKEEDKEIAKREERSFEAFIRGAAMQIRDDASASPLTKTANGAIVPKTIAKRVIRKLYDICPILERSTKYNVKGNLAIPYYDESETAITVAFQDEFDELVAASGKFTSINLGDYLIGALSKISVQLINNVDFPIVDYVVDAMAYSMKRFFEDVLLNGANGKVAGLGGNGTDAGVTLSKTAAAATAVTANELIELQDTVKDMFQENAMWIMSPKTRTAIRELKDNYGRYLLQDDISLPFGKSLLGKPIYVSDQMPDMAAGKTAIYYGDMSGLATKFSEDLWMDVLRERFITQGAYGVIARADFDAKVENAQKIAKLVMSSTTA